jgi:hypothetical protein
MTDRAAEMRVPLTGPLRSVALSPDEATLADIKRN